MYMKKLFFQFLSLSVFVDETYNYLRTKLFSYYNNFVLYTIVHNITDPYEKTYTFMWFPKVFFTFNYALYDLKISTELYCNKKFNFFESCVVYQNNIVHFVSDRPVEKISNDFKKMPFLSVSANNYSIKTINNLRTDIPLSANHICVLLRTDLYTNVLCIDYELNEITFKDIEIIK